MVDVSLSWELSPTDPSVVDEQRIYRTTTSSPTFPDDYSQIATVSDSTTSYTDSGIESDTYTYAVTAYRTDGSGYESDPTVVSVETAPFKPFDVVITDDSVANELTLNWDGGLNADGFYVYRAESSGSSQSDYIQVADIASPPYTDSGLEDGEKYYYRVATYRT